MGDKLLTISQAAKLLNIHWQTVRNYIKEGKLSYFKMGRLIRIRETDVNNLLKGQIPSKQRLEIESRFLLKDRKKLETNLLNLEARIIHHSHIIDHWFIPRYIKSQKQHDNWYDSGKGCGIRIREEDNGYTGRVITSMGTKKLTDALNHNTIMEAEVGIESYDQAMLLLEMMDRYEYLTIDKDRVVYSIENFKVCIDTIKGFGSGVEIEIDTNDDRNIALKQIANIATKIGIDPSQALETSMTRLAMKKLATF